MKQRFLFPLLALALIFSLSGVGCRPAQDPAILTDANSTYLQDPSGYFRIRAPRGFIINQDIEETGARLLHIQGKPAGQEEIVMYIEETGNSVATALDLLATTEGLQEVRREPVTVAGLQGIKMHADLSESGQRNVPYYVLSGGEGKKTYIFSLPGGKPWAAFDSAVGSFEVLR